MRCFSCSVSPLIASASSFGGLGHPERADAVRHGAHSVRRAHQPDAGRRPPEDFDGVFSAMVAGPGSSGVLSEMRCPDGYAWMGVCWWCWTVRSISGHARRAEAVPDAPCGRWAGYFHGLVGPAAAGVDGPSTVRLRSLSEGCRMPARRPRRPPRPLPKPHARRAEASADRKRRRTTLPGGPTKDPTHGYLPGPYPHGTRPSRHSPQRNKNELTAAPFTATHES